MKVNKKDFFRTLAVTLSLIGGYLYSCLIFCPKTSDDYNGSIYASLGYKSCDQNSLSYFCIGNSNMKHSLNPLIIYNERKITGYNNGIAGQTIESSFEYLKQAKNRQSFSLILIETDMLVVESRYYFNSYIDFNGLYFLETPYINHGKIKRMKAADFIFGKSDPFYQVCKGYSFLTSDLNDKYYGGLVADPTAKPLQIDSKRKANLDKIVSWAKLNEINILFYSSPTANISASYHNAMVNLSNEYGYQYIDLNESIYLSKMNFDCSHDFALDKHLNDNGAKKVSSFIGAELSNYYNLSPTSDQSIIKKWDYDYSEYCDLIIQAQTAV
jgi:hypothetical protein